MELVHDADSTPDDELIDDEIAALAVIVDTLTDLTHSAKRRILTYLNDRFPSARLKWINRIAELDALPGPVHHAVDITADIDGAAIKDASGALYEKNADGTWATEGSASVPSAQIRLPARLLWLPDDDSDRPAVADNTDIQPRQGD